jgi:flagellar biosynthesis/type III secretory pathway M-ring protein FliF/YscJ
MLVSILVPLAAVTAYDARPRSDEFEALASGLTSSESNAVLGHLEDRHVPYVLMDGGQTVMVPATQRAELTVELTRLALTRDGLFPARGNSGLTNDSRFAREIAPPAATLPSRAQAQARGASEQ